MNRDRSFIDSFSALLFPSQSYELYFQPLGYFSFSMTNKFLAADTSSPDKSMTFYYTIPKKVKQHNPRRWPSPVPEVDYEHHIVSAEECVMHSTLIFWNVSGKWACVPAALMSQACAQGTQMEVAERSENEVGCTPAGHWFKIPSATTVFIALAAPVELSFMFNCSCIHIHTGELTSATAVLHFWQTLSPG